MLLAVLEFWDFVIIGALVVALTGGAAMASRRSAGHAATAEERLRRMEDKLNVLLTHMGIDYVPRTKERWQRLADANDELEAAKEYSGAHSVALEEAKQVVEQYMADVQQST